MTKKNCFVVKTSTNNPCRKFKDMPVFCSSGCHTGKNGFCISNNETCQNYTKKKLLRNISEKDFDKKKKGPVKKIEETVERPVLNFMTQLKNRVMTVDPFKEDDVKKPVKKRGRKPVEKKGPVKKIEEVINPSVHRFMTQLTNKTMTVDDDVKKPVKKRGRKPVEKKGPVKKDEKKEEILLLKKELEKKTSSNKSK